MVLAALPSNLDIYKKMGPREIIAQKTQQQKSHETIPLNVGIRNENQCDGSAFIFYLAQYGSNP